MLFEKVLNCCLDNDDYELYKLFKQTKQELNWSIILTVCIDIQNEYMIEKICNVMKKIDIEIVYKFAINQENVNICRYHPFDKSNYKDFYFYALKINSEVMFHWLIEKKDGFVFENTIEYLAKCGHYSLLNSLRKYKKFPVPEYLSWFVWN